MKRHQEESMRVLYDSWQKSGSGKKAFALEHGLNPSTFYYWVKKFDGSTTPPVSKAFTEIEMDQTCKATAILHYPTGERIEWYGSPDSVHYLKSLL